MAEHPAPVLRFTPQVAALCLLAAGAWVLAVHRAHEMGNGPGTMGLGLAAFLGMWTLMMAAMMLPSVAPLASLYARGVTTRRPLRLATFTAGYLAVWIGAGLPAYGLLRLTGALAGPHRLEARLAAAVILTGAGLWQLSGAKDRCLAHCRSPLGLLLHYTGFRGPFKDLRAAFHHGTYCLACCWGLMALFAVFGVMNVLAMIGLAVVVLLEKVWTRGPTMSRLIGIACVGLAAAALVAPALTPGLHMTPGLHQPAMPMK